jgi:hypothetical protein
MPRTESGNPVTRITGSGWPATKRGSSLMMARARGSSIVTHSSSGFSSAVRASKQTCADSLPSAHFTRHALPTFVAEPPLADNPLVMARSSLLMRLAKKYLVSVQLLQKTLEINTQSMDQLRQILFHDIPTIRISDSYVAPEMATDLLEHDLNKLDILFQRGRESFASREQQLREYLI